MALQLYKCCGTTDGIFNNFKTGDYIGLIVRNGIVSMTNNKQLQPFFQNLVDMDIIKKDIEIGVLFLNDDDPHLEITQFNIMNDIIIYLDDIEGVENEIICEQFCFI